MQAAREPSPQTRPRGRSRARGRVLSVAPESRWSRLWRPFWALPAAICAAAVVLGLLLPPAEQRIATSLPYVFQGGPDGARSVLSTIATAMISVTGLVFSLTMVVLQLASSQFTPRVLGSFLSSRITQATLGVFTASFVFALTVLRFVQGASDGRDAFVPQLSVTIAFALVLASVGCFLAFIHHITTSIQVSHVVSRIGDETAAALDRVYPRPHEEAGPARGRTWSPEPDLSRAVVDASGGHGSVSHIDAAALVDLAERLDAVITLDVQIGDFVTDGQPLARVWGRDAVTDDDADALRARIWLAKERETRQEIGFGLRQLVDIAERALSPGINDPTTAIQVVDEIHRLLRILVTRREPSPYVSDAAGVVRLVHRPQGIEQMLRLGVEEIAHYGDDSPRVCRRLQAMLEDLADVSLPPYQGTIADLLARVSAATKDAQARPRS